MNAIVKLFAISVTLSFFPELVWADLMLELTPGAAAGHAEALSNASGTVFIKGEVDVRDFEVLNSLPESVTRLDMRGMKVAARATAQPNANGIRNYPASRIPDYAFFQCPVKEMIFPPGCSLGEGVLSCAKTEWVVLPEAMAEIPAYAFYNSSVRRIEGIARVAKVGAYAFYGSSVEVLKLPSLRVGGDYAMACMPSLRVVSLHPDAELGRGFLMECESLVHVDGVPKKIPGYFVADAKSLGLEDFTTESTEIGEYALTNINSRALVLAKGLMSVAEGSMAGMTRLMMIEANACGEDVPEVAESAFAGVDPSRVTLYVAPGSSIYWQADPVWRRFNIVEGLSSVSAERSDGCGISFAWSGSALQIRSAHSLIAVTVYDTSGRILQHETPGEATYILGFDSFGTSGPVVVRAENAQGSASISVLSR